MRDTSNGRAGQHGSRNHAGQAGQAGWIGQSGWIGQGRPSGHPSPAPGSAGVPRRIGSSDAVQARGVPGGSDAPGPPGAFGALSPPGAPSALGLSGAPGTPGARGGVDPALTSTEPSVTEVLTPATPYMAGEHPWSVSNGSGQRSPARAPDVPKAREASEAATAAAPGRGTVRTGTGGAEVAERQAPVASGGPHRAPSGPRADCTADRAGGLTFDVRLSEEDASAARSECAALLLHRRGDQGPAAETATDTGESIELADPVDTVRLPLTPVAGVGPTLRAALPSTVQLPEGRWDVYLDLVESEPARLLSGVNDLRSLVDRVPRESRTWLGVRIPYAAAHGSLSVRSWVRWPHAEAGELRVADGRMTLNGRLYGVRANPTARLQAEARDAPAPPVAAEVRTEADGAEFSAVLRYEALAGHPVWDLWLCPYDGAVPVRVGRILDDVPDKKQIFRYPSRSLGGNSELTATPYYTLDNDLAVRVEREAGEAGEAGDTADTRGTGETDKG